MHFGVFLVCDPVGGRSKQGCGGVRRHCMTAEGLKQRFNERTQIKNEYF